MLQTTYTDGGTGDEDNVARPVVCVATITTLAKQLKLALLVLKCACTFCVSYMCSVQSDGLAFSAMEQLSLHNRLEYCY